MNELLIDHLHHQSQHDPDRRIYTFLPDEGAAEITLTYRELDRRARAIGAQLQLWRATGERVLLMYPPGLDFVAAFFGCLYAGAIAVPVPPLSSAQSLTRVTAILADAQVRIGLSTNLIASMMERRAAQDDRFTALRWLRTDADLGSGDDWRRPAIDPDAPAYLQYTSGSTGAPKGVKISHRNLQHNVQVVIDAWEVTPDTVQVMWMPTFHDLGLVTGVVVPMYTATPAIILSPLSVMLRPARWLQTIARYRATFSGGPNFSLEQCIRSIAPHERDALDLRSWRIAYTGGEFVRSETLDRFAEMFAPCGFRREAFYPGYGLAESTLLVTAPSKSDRAAPPPTLTVNKAALEGNRIEPVRPGEEAIALIGCGGVHRGQRVAIVDPESRAPAPPDRIGEIWISGPSVAQGYWSQTEEDDPFQAFLVSGEGPFLRTGDLGFMRDGELYVTGRIKDAIIIRGRNLYPQDIEHSVEKSHLALKPGAGAAFSIEVDAEERLVVVHEVDRHHHSFDEVIDAIREAVAEEHLVRVYAIALISEGRIPKTSSGKIARRPCRARFLEGSLETLHEWRDQLDRAAPMDEVAAKAAPASSEIESWLATHIARVAGIDARNVDRRQLLTRFGLDSMDAVRLVRQMEDWLARPLSPTLFWNYPTIESLARHLAGESPDASIESTPNRSSDSEPIAIIGIGCRFPGADTPDDFWQMLREGRDAVRDVPAERWHADAFYDPDAATPGKMHTRRGAFLENVDRFDAAFFNISPREATAMDPQQRLMLEVAWEALENAGASIDRLAGSRTGVFVGISVSEYYQLQLLNGDATTLDMYAGTGNALTIAANRLSYLLDLRGPSLAVDTACSSSLVAVHLACQSLRSGESNVAIAAGVNVILSPESSVVFSSLGVLSSDGRCKTFDERADGYGRGEGAGVVVLKRLSDALNGGDRILALIRGSAVNQDGRSNGLTAPNGLAQQAVIHESLRMAGLTPADLSYVEAHGTGTRLGDPIEVESLQAVLADAPSESPCYLGSVKTNIGHLEPAAGIAGLIKVVLSIQHGEIPPHLHLENLNAFISLNGSRLVIPTERCAWPAPTRVAGVSAFALGGTNAHVILSEPPPVESATEGKPWQLLTISARSEAALEHATANLAGHLKRQPDLDLADVAYTLQVGRKAFQARRALVCQSVEEAIEALETRDGSRLFTRLDAPGASTRSIVFMFSGQGAQHVDMAGDLCRTEPIFREQVDRCAELLKPHLGIDLRNALYAGDDRIEAARQIDETVIAQPALFVVEYALATLWMAWGVRPQAMLGHSIGEYVAACLAGVLSLEDALMLVAARGRLMQSMPRGAMLGVALSEHETQAFLGNGLSLAAINGPAQCVVSGTIEAIEALQHRLDEQGIECRKLHTSHAFHSEMMEPILESFAAEVGKVRLSAPQIPYLSNLTGTWIGEAEATDPRYYAEHLRRPVRFADNLHEALQDSERILLEVGPGRALSGLARRHPDAAQSLTLSSLPHPNDRRDDAACMLEARGKLWLAGCEIDWARLHAHERRKRVVLPTYPFERQRYWIERRARRLVGSKADSEKRAGIDGWFYRPIWRPAALPDSRASIENVRWLVFGDEDGFGAQLAGRLRLAGHAVVVARRGERFTRLRENVYAIDPDRREDYDALLSELQARGRFPQKIAHAWGVDSQADELDAAGLSIFYSLLYLAQSLGRRSDRSPIEIDILSSDMQAVTPDDAPQPLKATLLGPCKVIPQEYPHIACRSIDLALAQAEIDPILDQLAVELSNAAADGAVAYRNGARWVQAFEAAPIVDRAGIPARLRERGVYLITGGLGGIGLELAGYLARAAHARLALIGRSAFPARDEWDDWLKTHLADDRTSRAIFTLKRLEESGAEVLPLRADVTDEVQMQQAITQITSRFGAIHGVIHAAGIAGGGLIQLKSREAAAQVLAPKVQGALVLNRVLQAMHLDFFALCSSLSALLGGLGQVDYCAANAFLDAFAHYLARAHGAPAISIDWDAWQEVGMAAGKLSPRAVEAIAHPLLDACIETGSQRAVLVTRLKAPLPWPLDEHRILSGRPVIPGTAYLEMARAAYAHFAGRDGAIELREVSFVTPCTVANGEKEVHTIIQRKDGDVCSFEIASKVSGDDRSAWQTHAFGEIASIDAGKPIRHRLDKIAARCSPRRIDAASELRFPNYGPRWQNLRRVSFGQNEALASIELPADFAADLSDFVLHPALLDVATGFASREAQGRYLPFEYRRVQVMSPLPAKFFSHVRYNQAPLQGETLSFDVTLMSEDGIELVRIDGLALRKVADVDALAETVAPERNFRLEIASPGALDDLALKDVPRRAPGPSEIEIEVYAAGLNFKDVLSALGIFSEPLGMECAGRVVAVGEGVTAWRIGDEAIALSPACFSAFTTTSAQLAVPKPAHMSFEEAASIPIVFLTAYYALHHLGRLRRGERVLIHAAAGGVGLAAVQIAQNAGAEIFATAGSLEKRSFLRALGIEPVMDSRSVAFADEVMARTAGRGMDVILNSLAGEFLHKSLETLSAYGRFLEIGKQDILQNNALRLNVFDRNAAFFAIDIGRMLRERPEAIAELLGEVMQLFRDGKLKPLPQRIFPIAQAASAFEHMARARHIGKVVLSVRRAPIAPPALHATARQESMSPGEGVEAFKRILAQEQLPPQIVVSVKDWPSVLRGGHALASAGTLDEPAADRLLHPRPSLTSSYVAPRNDAERTIADAWQKLLGIDRIGIHDNFFELGGDSLIAVQANAHLKRKFGVELPAASLFEAPTIAAIVKLLNRNGDETPVFEERQARGARRRAKLQQRQGA